MIDVPIPSAPDETDRRGLLGFDWLSGGGEMGALIRSFDWSATPVGPVHTWPQSLRTALGICLCSRFPMAIWWGPEIVQFYNDGYRPFLGIKHPRSMGQRGDDCWREIWEVCGPLYHHVMRTGESTWSADLQLLMDRNGYVEETYFTFAYSPIHGELGDVQGNLITVTETTERVIGERRLKTLRDLGAMATAAKTQNDACRIAADILAVASSDIPFAALYLLEAEGRQARLFGVAGFDRGTKASPETIDLAAADANRWPISQVVASRRSVIVDDLSRFGQLPTGPWVDPPRMAMVLPLTTADGIVGALVVGISPRRALDDAYSTFVDLLAGQIATAIANARAYEQERRRAEALAELDRAKTAFFSNVSHEFRTPLTLMLGSLEDELRERPCTPRLEMAHRNSLRMLKLVNTLLDFSRIEAGRMQAYFEPTDLAAFTVELASMFRSAIERAGLRLILDCPPLSEPVYVDRAMWEKIVLNLMSNALKFTFEGEILVALRPVEGKEGNAVQLVVRDTGEGIATADLSHLFERFYQAQQTRSRTHEGSGIGLALVQELVKLHAGTVGVQSEYGKGSAFSVTIAFGTAHLPADRIGAPRLLQPAASGATAFIEEALRWLPADVRGEALGVRGVTSQEVESGIDALRLTPDTSRATRPRVLVVDDNADMRRYLRRLLERRFDVVAEANGEAALAAARARSPDVVLADVMMPRLDGFGLLREWRSDPALKTIPVILLSARAGEESRVEGLERGADDYLIKPFTARELLARIDAHVDMALIRRQAEQAVRESEARFREMADNAPVMVWMTEPDGSCSFLSKSWYEFTGQAHESGLGFGWLDAVHPDDRPGTHETFVAANAKHETFQLDYRLRRKDGEYRWVINSAAPRMARNGCFLGYIGSVIDITERKRAEEAKSRLAAIVESSDDAIIGKDINGIITSWNAGAEKLFGYTAQEAVGRSITMLMPPERVHEEADILDRIRRGERIKHYETVRRRKDGELLDISLTISPITNASGSIVGASKIARNITERKRQEADLFRRGRQQRLLYELATAVNRAEALTALYDKALDTIISALNADRASILLFNDDGVMRFEAWRGLSSDYRRAVEGHSPWQRDTPEPRAILVGNIDEADIAPHVKEVVRAEGIQALSFIPLMYGGRLLGKFMVYFNRPHVMNEEEVSLAHTIAGTLALGIERKAGEEALRRLNDELEARIDDRTRDLMASQQRLRALATELNLTEQRERQRLASELHDYLGQLLALGKIKLAQAKKQAVMPAVAKAMGDVQQVMDQALNYTRTLIAQLSPPVLREFGLPSALKWLAEQMQERNLTVDLDLKQEVLLLPEDQAMLMFQSVRELLINIVKHGRTDRAKVTAIEAEETLRITVVDQGAGFDVAAAGRGEPSSRRGFGLFSIHERMYALGGQFHIESVPGQGTTATLVLPLHTQGVRAEGLGVRGETHEELDGTGTEHVQSEGHQSSACGSSPGFASRLTPDASRVVRVLLVDDHAMVRQGLRGLLDGYADIEVIGEAANGEEAVSSAESARADIVVMDANMPIMDGIEATRRLKRMRPQTLVIGLSVDDGPHIEQAMREAGAAAFHTKEAAVDELYRSIQTLIGRRSYVPGTG